MKNIYPRWQSESIADAMKTRRVLLLSGARQCGKTTLAKQMLTDQVEYRTLDDLSVRAIAQNDPAGFVKHQKSTLIIDEVQHVPELLSAIKLRVDEDSRPGQFLLTGSANIQAAPGVTESLAGRIRSLRLRTLSHGEMKKVRPTFLERAFNSDFAGTAHELYDRESILNIAFRGGFPEALALSDRERTQWHRDYVCALIQRDLADITRIQRYDAMRQLTEVLAAWSGKFMDISAIGAGLSIRRPTLETYINALEALYIIERVSPWTKTDYERVGKQPKLFMSDPGLMASILGWKYAQLTQDSDRSGKLVETFVFNEIASQVDAHKGEYSLYHYRDREKREVDFIVEREDGALLGIEVKAGSAVNQTHFKHLHWFKDSIAGKREFTGIVLYTGSHAGSFGKGLWAVPFAHLWIS
jgi:predicted AAA+ superfamily ATPase